MTSNGGLELPVNESCAFCAYIRGEREYTVWRWTTLSSVLVTREQRGIAHVLAIPRRHAPTLLDLTDDEASDLMTCIRFSARAISAAYAPAGISVWQNNGVPASQTIAHAHFHIAGALDDGGTEWGEVPEISVAATSLIAERLDAHS